MDQEAWRVTVHGVAKSPTRLSDFHFTSAQYKSSVYFKGISKETNKNFCFLNVLTG